MQKKIHFASKIGLFLKEKGGILLRPGGTLFDFDSHSSEKVVMSDESYYEHHVSTEN